MIFSVNDDSNIAPSIFSPNGRQVKVNVISLIVGLGGVAVIDTFTRVFWSVLITNWAGSKATVTHPGKLSMLREAFHIFTSLAER